MSRTLKVTGNHIKFARFVFLAFSEEKQKHHFFFVQCVIRKIKITVNRRFDVSNIILKIEVVYASVKVVMREIKILNI